MMIKTYRKKTTIKAEKFNPKLNIPEYVYDDAQRAEYTTPAAIENMISILRTGKPKPDWKIETKEGNMRINPGDWIATGIDGEHWAIADDIFKKTYEEVEDDEHN